MYIFAKLISSLIYLRFFVFNLYVSKRVLFYFVVVNAPYQEADIPLEVTVIVLCVYFAGSPFFLKLAGGFCARICCCFLQVLISIGTVVVPRNPRNRTTSTYFLTYHLSFLAQTISLFMHPTVRYTHVIHILVVALILFPKGKMAF